MPGASDLIVTEDDQRHTVPASPAPVTALPNADGWPGFGPVTVTAAAGDHKAYYDPRDLWPMLVRAGFKPSLIRCHRHKLGLNTSAVCRVP